MRLFSSGCAPPWVLAGRILLTLFCWELPVFISSAIAQTAPAAAAAGGDFTSTLTGMLPLVLMFVVLYFVMIRPQMKRQKEHRAMIDAIAKGDEVVIGGGMLGKVTRLSEQYLHVEVASGVEVQVQRGGVAQVLPKGTIK
jgi:preprotein translocase subunit YajC